MLVEKMESGMVVQWVVPKAASMELMLVECLASLMVVMMVVWSDPSKVVP